MAYYQFLVICFNLKVANAVGTRPRSTTGTHLAPSKANMPVQQGIYQCGPAHCLPCILDTHIRCHSIRLSSAL